MTLFFLLQSNHLETHVTQAHAVLTPSAANQVKMPYVNVCQVSLERLLQEAADQNVPSVPIVTEIEPV